MNIDICAKDIDSDFRDMDDMDMDDMNMDIQTDTGIARDMDYMNIDYMDMVISYMDMDGNDMSAARDADTDTN